MSADYLRWKSNFEEISFEILRNEARLSQDFSVVGSSPNDGCSNRESTLAHVQFVLGIEICCEVDDLSCLGMLEKCRRLAR